MIKDFEDLFRFDLQLFAEDGDEGGSGDEGGDGNGGGSDNGGEGGDNGDKPMSFDDFLKGKGNQAEFDRRVNKAVETAVNNAKEKWQALTDSKLSEAEKLAKMTKDEKREYENKKLQEELAELKLEKAMSEMAGTARSMLKEEGIDVPDSLLKHLVQDDADKTKKAVEEFAKTFNETVQAAVKEALKGKTPDKGGGKNTITKEQIFAIKDSAERQKLIRENMHLFE